jgi:hypothetical protein
MNTIHLLKKRVTIKAAYINDSMYSFESYKSGKVVGIQHDVELLPEPYLVVNVFDGEFSTNYFVHPDWIVEVFD